jgi:hypothetical protein
VVEAEIKDFQGVWRWWLMPVIVATWEAEIWRIAVWGQPV